MRISLLLLVLVAAGCAARREPPAAGANADAAHCCGPVATSAGITESDLRSRIYAFADDSMQGRLTGSAGAMKGTAYIAAELKRLGLEPAGDRGTYFQDIPFGREEFDSTSTISAGGTTLHAGSDFYVQPKLGTASVVGSTEVVYYGSALDTTHVLSPDEVRGKILVLSALAAVPARVNELLASKAYQRYLEMTGAAAITLTIVGPQIPAPFIRANFPPTTRVGVLPAAAPAGGSSGLATFQAAEALIGAPRASFTPGMKGKTVDANVRYTLTRLPARNVAAILRGSDDRLRGSFVALGAHSDHIGLRETPVDHDSMRVSNGILRPGGAEDQARAPTADESARIRRMIDSLHALHGARLDSISNGADDDGSGSMGLLEIAEAFAKQDARPKRSLLFVWHMGEEQGMKGSRYFTDHLPVPADSIVAQLNIDMIGRGGTNDVTGKTKDGQVIHGRDEGYLQLIGSRRLSKELGDIVERVNVDRRAGFELDYALDANGHPQNIYCRSDHAMYARLGIPVTFFSTGGHQDYHQVTDEPQYLRFDQYRRVTQFIHDVALTVANLDHRPKVDGPKPNPNAECRQ